jgi:hypothetical protein
MARPKGPKISGSQRMAEIKLAGMEPQGLIIGSDFELIKAMNWYAAYGDRDPAFEYLRKYMISTGTYSKAEISAITIGHVHAIDWITVMSLGHRAHLMTTRKCVFAQYLVDRFNDQLKAQIEKALVRKSEHDVNNVVRIPTFTAKDKAYEDLGEIEAALDAFLENYTSDFNAYDWLRTRATPAVYVNIIIERYGRIIEDLETVDPDEMTRVSPKNRKLHIAFLRKIIEECELYTNARKVQKQVVRKPRKIKEKSAEYLTKNVRFLKESSEYKIVSIPPTSVLGAERLLCFNVKSKNFFVYVANDAKGLQFNGTRLENVNLEPSSMKHLRKPSEVLSQFVNGNKLACSRVFAGIKAREAKGNKKIDENTLLIKVFK